MAKGPEQLGNSEVPQNSTTPPTERGSERFSDRASFAGVMIWSVAIGTSMIDMIALGGALLNIPVHEYLVDNYTLNEAQKSATLAFTMLGAYVGFAGGFFASFAVLDKLGIR